jgi:hypothetical protein
MKSHLLLHGHGLHLPLHLHLLLYLLLPQLCPLLVHGRVRLLHHLQCDISDRLPKIQTPVRAIPSLRPGHVVHKQCNACIYSCLCGSLLESVQEGKGEIIYHIRQAQF